MQDTETVLKARLNWVEVYQRTGNAALTCRRCGVSSKTLRKWRQRYQAQGVAGLRSRGRRPHRLRSRKVTPEQESLILHLRRTRRLGPKGLQRELLRLHPLRFFTRTIYHLEGVARSWSLALTSLLAPPAAQTLHPSNSGRPRASRHLQGGTQPLPVHRH